MNTTHKTILYATLVTMLTSISLNALADNTWQKNHPRREQVNQRLDNQNQRIQQQVKEGDLSKQQASHIHREDHRIRQEQRQMASQNGGGITHHEQTKLNQQENKVSQQISQ